MKQVEYNPTITFGNIINTLMTLGALVGVYVAHDRRITVIETQIPTISMTINTIVADQKLMAIDQKATIKALDKLVILGEERARVTK